MNVSVSLLAVLPLTSTAVTPLRVLDDVSLEFRLRSERRPVPPSAETETESVELDVDLRRGGARTGMITPCV